MKILISIQALISLVLILPNISFAQQSDSISNNTSRSKFATLYLYHPNEGPLGIFKIHIGDSVIWKTKYNTKHEIKLYSEGKTELWTRPRRETSLTIDVKFGEKYFVKCWLLAERNIFKPIIKPEDTIRGRMEYAEVKRNPDSLKLVKALDTVTRRNTIYFELGGQASIYSLNYDRLLRANKKIKNSVSVGFAIYPIPADLFIIAPLSYNFLLGKKNHYLELGIGTSVLFQKYTNWEYPYSQIGIRSVRKDYFLFASPKIGYRYQKLYGGIFFRAVLTPIMNIVQYFGAVKYKNASQYNSPSYYRFFEPMTEWGLIVPWGGLSIGYSFNPRKNNSKK